MKLETKKTELHQNVGSQTFEVGSDLESRAIQFRLIMDKLYTNPLRATIREIISNAIDANKEAGSENQIDITLPGLEPSLWIRDYGLGISPKRMEEYYTKVFTSTKRDSNKGIGCYGIGRLSALSLAEQYPLITRVEGTEYHYAIYLNEHGIPDLSLLHKEKTTKPNGTSVGIPTSDTERVKEYLIETLAFTEVKVKCQELEDQIQKEQQNVLFSTKDWAIRAKSNRNVAIEVGGVPYNLPSKISEHIETKFFNEYGISGCLSHSFLKEEDSQIIKFIPGFRTVQPYHEVGVILRVPIGILDISTSREYLQDTDNNREIIQGIINKLSAEVPAYLNNTTQQISVGALSKYVFDCPSLREYFSLNDISIEGYRVHGLDIPSNLLSKSSSLPLVLDFNKEDYSKKIYYSPCKEEKIGQFIFRGEELEKASNLKSLMMPLERLTNSQVILHESSKKGSLKLYQSYITDFEDSRVLVLLVDVINEDWRNHYPVLSYLESQGTTITIIKRKKTKPSSNKTSSIPVKRYIRPVLDKLEGNQWSEMFRKKPVEEMPSTGFYVTVSFSRLQVEMTLLTMTEEERKQVYFVTESQVYNLPDTFQDLETYLDNRRKEREGVENFLLEKSYKCTSQHRRLNTLYYYFQDYLNIEAKSFLQNFDTHVRHYTQEVVIKELWKRPNPHVNYTTEEINRGLFNSSLSNDARSLLSYLLFKGEKELIQKTYNIIQHKE